MIDINDYDALEKYIEQGICKIIGYNFVNKDNIDKVVSKVIFYNHKYDPSKNMSYDSYIYMIVKTACLSIYKETYTRRTRKNKFIKNYLIDRQPTIDKYKESSESFMYLVDTIINNDNITHEERTILEKRYIESKSVKQVAFELSIKKKDVHRIIKNVILKIRSLYKNIESLEEEVEVKHGKIIS